MATSLLDGLMGLLTPALLSTAGRSLGESEGSVATGLGAAFPTILAGLSGKAGDPPAMRPLFDLINSPANDDSVLRDPRLAVNVAPQSALGGAAGSLLSGLFGSQLSSVGDVIGRTAGLRAGAGGSLLKIAAPLVLGVLGNRVRSGGLDLPGLSSLLLGEQGQLTRALPAGMGSILGLQSAPVPQASTPSTPRWLWPALAALALVAVLWGLTRNRRPAPAEQTVGVVRDTLAEVPKPAGGTTTAGDVVDVVWEWVSTTTPVEEVKVNSPDRYTLRLGSDGHLALKADCNRGAGSYAIGGDRALTVKPIALTRAMCPPGSLSDRFVKDVGRATSYFVKDSELYLELPTDSGTLRFRRQG
jgi:heat shock protein HslJ